MPQRMPRRQMLKTSAAIGAGLWMAAGHKVLAGESPNEKLNLAFIGVGGRGGDNLRALAKEHVVALCDVDEVRAGKAYEQFPQAKKYVDFRRMLDELDRHLDGVVISTPDHTHFHPAAMAMRMGKHVYLEKPLAHTVAETRELTRLAAEKKLATQLGAQRHAMTNMHRVVELIQAGAIGTVQEVHCWIGGTRGMPAIPTDQPAVPATLNWDLWIGPARYRPYHPTYCPYGWRFWWDFGTGETGNWGCHILDIPYWALGLKYPTKVEASGPPVHPQTTPKQMATRFEFPADGQRGAVTLHWYHADKGPEVLRQQGLPAAGNNTLFIGSEGMLLCGFGQRKLYPEAKFADYQAPAPSIPDSPGFYREWLEACKGGAPATCDFVTYSGALAETVLLGNAAYRAGGFAWDAESLTAVDNDRAAAFLRPEYRAGWRESA